MSTTYPEATSGDRLSFTLFMAAAIHAMIIFGFSFAVNSGQKIAPTLNITLATHKDNIAPDTADFLAQHNQQASGTGDQVKEITTRDLAKIADTTIRDIKPEAQQRATTESRHKTQILSTKQLKDRRTNKNPDPEKSVTQEEKKGLDMDAPLFNPEYASLQAKLAREKWEEANKPRIRRLISVSTKSAHDAAYLNSWQQKIEFIGNENFPQEALNNNIFGQLRLAVRINSNGGIENIDISQSSGHKVLDDAALQIVRLAAPFERFPPEISKGADQLEIIRTWRFQITGLSTSN
ncbi:TonB family protein [Teredinibacter haidensis]|uniref:TonB family protein n=1 Tax=Teredinibacter haidensis TaxID=2731755 RepID=UPI000948E9C7|nr:TonB family protein [Teredinibacter haidensis]